MWTSNGFELDPSPRRSGELQSVPAADRGDRSALWQRLRRDGFLLLRGLLDRQRVLDLREFYFRTMQGVGLIEPGTPPLEGRDSGEQLDRTALRQRLFGQIVPSPQFVDFCGQEALRGWFEWFYDDETFLHQRKILRHVRPGECGIGTATQAHYDLVYLREGTDRLLSAWIPVGDIPREVGPLVYLEGSHVHYRRLEAEGALGRPRSLTADLPALARELDRRWLLADFRAGDVVVHSPHVVHASLDNVDPHGRIRLSTDIRYQRAGDPIDWRWQEHWKDDDGL